MRANLREQKKVIQECFQASQQGFIVPTRPQFQKKLQEAETLAR